MKAQNILLFFIVSVALNSCYLTTDIIEISKNEEGKVDSFFVLLTPFSFILDVLFVPFTLPEFFIEGIFRGDWYFFKRPKEKLE